MPFKSLEPLQAGEIILFTTGCYSDFTVASTHRVLRAFDLTDQETLYRHDCSRDPCKPKSPNMYGFAAYLESQKLLEDFVVREVHLGSYRLGDGDEH